MIQTVISIIVDVEELVLYKNISILHAHYVLYMIGFQQVIFVK